MTSPARAIEGFPTHPIDLPVLLKESGLVALVVFGLAFSLLGFKLEDVPGGLKVVVRFGDVALVTVIAFFGRAGLVLLRQGRQLPVMLTMLPFAVVLIVALLYVQITGAPYIASWLPFGGSQVINWLLALLALSIGIRAAWLYWQSVGDNREQSSFHLDQFATRLQSVTRLTGPILLLIALILPFLPFADRRVIDILILTVTYIMLGWGLNIVVGLAGLLDLGYVAFYAVGAYSYALLALHFDMGFWICLPFAGIMAAFAGILLGFPVLRLRGDYLAIVTLGFGEIVRVILLNWYTFTKGPDGISGIPRPSFFGLPFKRYPAEGAETFHSFFNLTYSPIDRIIFLYYVILVLALLTNLFTLRIRKLPIGRAWEALREDETACRSLGINPRNTKLTAFSIGAMFAGIGGSFFATRQGFISPESFTFIESAIILAIVVLGGMGSQIGVVFAAILLIGLPEFFRELHQYRMLAFGAAMIAIMVWRPKGLLVFRKPTISLFARDRQ
ncbi:high-affinity branched-chain amino acid ABC transporter permease LivM [Pseudomonadota bacterium]